MNVLAKPRNPNRDRSFEIYKENDGKIKPSKIAALLNEKATNIRSWKSCDEWDKAIGKNKKIGAPKKNNNASGHGAPKENFNAVKHGGYISDDRFFDGLPKTMKKSMENRHNEKYIDKLWRSILIQEERIISMQKISYVKNKKDMTKELKKKSEGNVNSEEFEIQFAWDKENNSMTALSRAMDTLAKLIEKYDKIANANWDLVTEEQKLRIEKIKGEVSNLNKENKDKDITIKVMKASEQLGK